MKLPKVNRTTSGIAYWSIGSGDPTIITVHGAPGTDHTFFRPYLNPLAGRQTLVYFDLPGHGDSLSTNDYSLHAMAESIEDVRMAVGAKRVTLLGSSYGGFLSLLYALQHQDRLKSLVLVDTSASYGFRGESLETAKRRGTPTMLEALERLWNGSLQTDSDFHRDWREILPLYFHQVALEDVRKIADTATYHLDTRKSILPTLRDYDIRNELESIRCPTLVIAGRHDWITSVAQAEALASGIPRSDLLIFEKSGHYPFIDEANHFLQCVEDWLVVRGG
jgi:proline iminopeptidase